MERNKCQPRPKLGAEIGQGSFGRVYRVQHDAKVVLKLCKGTKGDLIDYSRLRETAALTLLNKSDVPYFVKFKKSYRYSVNKWGLFLESFEHDLTQQHEFTDNQIRNLFFKIVNGVLYLHNRNLMHRDLKNRNILRKSQTVAFCDFGSITYTFGQPSQTAPRSRSCTHNFTQSACTLTHRAPELIFNSTNYTEAVDIWSLGVILAEMYVGSHVFWTYHNNEYLGTNLNVKKRSVTYNSSDSETEEEVNDTFHNLCKCFGTQAMKKLEKYPDYHNIMTESKGFYPKLYKKGLGLSQYLKVQQSLRLPVKKYRYPTTFSKDDGDINTIRRPREIPADAIKLIAKMLKINPNDRLPVSEIIDDPFFQGRTATEPIITCPIRKVELTDLSQPSHLPVTYKRAEMVICLYKWYLHLSWQNLHTLFSAVEIAHRFTINNNQKYNTLDLVACAIISTSLYESTRIIEENAWVDATEHMYTIRQLRKAPIRVETVLKHDFMSASEWMYVQALQQRIIPTSKKKRDSVLLLTEALLISSLLSSSHTCFSKRDISTTAFSIALSYYKLQSPFVTSSAIRDHLMLTYKKMMKSRHIISNRYNGSTPLQLKIKQ